MADLDRVLKDPSTGEYRSVIQVRFKDPSGSTADRTEAGNVWPDQASADIYYVTVKLEEHPLADLPFMEDAPPGVPSRGWSYWPIDGVSCAIAYSYAHPASLMAGTLNHELTHVWYFHEGSRATFGLETGHASDVETRRCMIEDDFLDRIKAFMSDIEALDRQLRRRR